MRDLGPTVLRFILLALLAVAGAPVTVRASADSPRQIPLCAVHRARTCIVDGDTIWLAGKKIRLEDIDAPETHADQYKCPAEKALGDRATLRLQQLLSAGWFDVVQVGSRPVDVYGRELRTLEIGGKSVGQELVAEGLAHEWVGHKLPWCG